MSITDFKDAHAEELYEVYKKAIGAAINSSNILPNPATFVHECWADKEKFYIYSEFLKKTQRNKKVISGTNYLRYMLDVTKKLFAKLYFP